MRSIGRRVSICTGLAPRLPRIALIYEEPDKGFFISLSRLQAGASPRSPAGITRRVEVRLLDLEDAEAKPRLVAPRKTGERYDVEHHPAFGGEDTLIIHTNADGAEDFKIMTAPLANPGRDEWRELVPHRPGTLLLDINVLRDWLVRLERTEGLPRIVVRRLASGEEHTIAFDEEAYSLGMAAGFEFDDRHPALRLFVDDDAERGLGLRHARRATRVCASARKCRPATIRRTT